MKHYFNWYRKMGIAWIIVGLFWGTTPLYGHFLSWVNIILIILSSLMVLWGCFRMLPLDCFKEFSPK